MIRVLLVDDDESNRVTLGAVLEDEGYDVTEVATASEAKQLATEGAGYQIAVLDQHLGDDLGTELASALRAAHPGLRVVLLSGSLLEHPETPVDAFLTKGTDLATVLATLRRLTEG